MATSNRQFQLLGCFIRGWERQKVLDSLFQLRHLSHIKGILRAERPRRLNSFNILIFYLFDALFALFQIFRVEVALLVRVVLTFDSETHYFTIGLIHVKPWHIRVIIRPLIAGIYRCRIHLFLPHHARLFSHFIAITRRFITAHDSTLRLAAIIAVRLAFVEPILPNFFIICVDKVYLDSINDRVVLSIGDIFYSYAFGNAEIPYWVLGSSGK